MSEGQNLEISALNMRNTTQTLKLQTRLLFFLYVMFVTFTFLLIIVHIVVCFLDLLKSTLLKQSLFQQSTD